MFKPKDYKQYDSRWGAIKYDKQGCSTIKSAGCGPTCAAMVIATLTDKEITPKDTCAWSLKNGYKYPSGGTYYSYIVSQLKKFEIKSIMMNSANVYHKPDNQIHAHALSELKQGNWLIACMGVGNWTKGGHYILVYGYQDGYVYINDPASTKQNRLKAKWSVFKNEVKYYWSVDINVFIPPKNEFTKESTTLLEVMWLQEKLGVEVDGSWGPITAKAVQDKRESFGWKRGNGYKCTEKMIRKLN